MEWKARYEHFWFYSHTDSSMQALGSVHVHQGVFTAERYVPSSYMTELSDVRQFSDIRSAALWCMEHAKQYE